LLHKITGAGVIDEGLQWFAGEDCSVGLGKVTLVLFENMFLNFFGVVDGCPLLFG